MKIVAFVNRCLRAFVGPWDRPGHQPHPAIENPVIRLPRQTVAKPIVRWRTNPVSGRLECRWTVTGTQPGPEASSLERFGAILAFRENARLWH